MADHSSFANVSELRVKHADLDLNVDFASHIISGVAKLTAVAEVDGVSRLVLDTRDLNISSAQVAGADVAFKLQEAHEALGSALEITLPASLQKGQEVTVSIGFAASPNSSAVQFLEPSQTAGGRHPYLFTQCQAIHARSLLPCQDTPAAKMTYSASVTVPQPLTALMSAVARNDGKPESAAEATHTFGFDQKVPIPSYLVALVVGELESREVGPRSRVWSEPSMVEAGQWEFANTEDFIKAAEEIAGPYVWGRYDILLLPPSFPYGGMENPCLTFATPTLLAGDRSLTNVVAHEIAHSWTGNFVTNRTWEHFWLNEGLNVFLERKIIGRLHGEPTFNLHAAMGRNDLSKAVERIGAEHNFTRLVPDLSGGKDPDDAFSAIPYEKGFHFCCYLEALVGGPSAFMPWFKDSWIAGNAYQTVDSNDFKRSFSAAFPEAAAKVDWEAWFYTPGYPKEENTYNDTLGDASRRLAAVWHAEGADAAADEQVGSAEDITGWHADQLILFLDEVAKKPLSLARCRRLGEVYGLAKSRNSEVRLRWCEIAIAAKNPDVLPAAAAFITEQGRMKFVRPIYRAMFNSEMGRQLALDTFQRSRSMYHPVCQKMLEADLGLRQADVATF